MNAALNPQNKPNSPTRIDHYRIVKKLGQGGMSIVYEGFDERLKRPVAIKVLHPFLAESEEYRARFLREAFAVARLTHPSIVQIFDVSRSENRHEHLYIVTELLVGQTLKEFVKCINMIEVPEISGHDYLANYSGIGPCSSKRYYSPRYQAREHHDWQGWPD